jgi:hypothetical protein
MSLDFDVSNVPNYLHVTTSPWTRGKPQSDQTWHPVTNALVWLSMTCGYSSITSDNFASIARRIGQYQQVFGPYLSSAEWPATYITLEDVRMHIGLRTNASRVSEKQWQAHLIRMMERDVQQITNGHRNVLRGPIGDIVDKTALSAYEVQELINAAMVAKAEQAPSGDTEK